MRAEGIKQHRPHYNVTLKDDKHYPFLKLTNEAFPMLVVTRRVLKDGGRYYGGGPLYRDREDRYVNGYGGGYAYRDYRTGRMVTTRDNGDVVKQAPTRVQSRTTVVSRGGFGGGGRSFGG